jgi:hypothetical protein
MVSPYELPIRPYCLPPRPRQATPKTRNALMDGGGFWTINDAASTRAAGRFRWRLMKAQTDHHHCIFNQS